MTWHILSVTGGKELAACAALARYGYTETWYPTRVIDARPRAKVARSMPGTKRRRTVAHVPGYVFLFLRPGQPLWCHVINGHEGGVFMRVLSPGGVPYEVRDADMARMKQVPDRIRQLVEEVRERERQEAEAKRPRVGQIATVTEPGAFAGWRGTVLEITASGIRLDCDLGRITVPHDGAERVAEVTT